MKIYNAEIVIMESARGGPQKQSTGEWAVQSIFFGGANLFIFNNPNSCFLAGIYLEDNMEIVRSIFAFYNLDMAVHNSYPVENG